MSILESKVLKLWNLNYIIQIIYISYYSSLFLTNPKFALNGSIANILYSYSECSPLLLLSSQNAQSSLR